jgi:hypothetical protein
MATLASKLAHESALCAPSVHDELVRSLPLLSENGVVLHKDLGEDLRSKAIYFGTGLCTTKMMSAAIPFDFLSVVATAEQIRRVCGFGQVIHLIADSHAKSNHFVSDEAVDRCALRFKETALKVADYLGLGSVYKVILASEIDSSAEYREILDTIPAHDSHEYVRREWADMEYLARHLNVSLKLSWRMPLRKQQTHHSDENFFDEGFSKHFARPYSFVYMRAALTFDPSRLNVCPYTSIPDEKRLLLDFSENAKAKLTEFMIVPHKAKQKAYEQTETILKMVEGLSESCALESSLGERVYRLLRIIFA